MLTLVEKKVLPGGKQRLVRAFLIVFIVGEGRCRRGTLRHALPASTMPGRRRLDSARGIQTRMAKYLAGTIELARARLILTLRLP